MEAIVRQRQWRTHPVQIKADGADRLRMPGKSPGEEHLPKEQGYPRKRQSIVPEEAKRSNEGLQALQWCKHPEEDEQIKRYGVTENTPTKQTKPGDGIHPDKKFYAVL